MNFEKQDVTDSPATSLDEQPSVSTRVGAIAFVDETSAVKPTSRLQGFAQLDPKTRVQKLISMGFLTEADEQVLLENSSLSVELADSFIENCVGGFSLPLGIATNFLIDGEEYVIPMAVEESSVIAAASHGAKLTRSGGGFVTEPVRTIATCQIQFYAEQKSKREIEHAFDDVQQELMDLANACHPRLVERGGGVVAIELRHLKQNCFAIHLHVDTREAMGANIVNTMAEEIGKVLPQKIGCTVGLKILTNLTVHRVSKVSCEVTPQALEVAGFSGTDAIERICRAFEFADMCSFRAATHNKGVMNGIDPVIIATGNDWRAVEAGCHAYAALDGRYKPMTRWFKNEQGNLEGHIAVPIAVGTVGGVTKLHPGAAASLRLLRYPTASKLSNIIAAVGLAQNLSALRALACEGIQRGHMALHEKNIEMMKRYDNAASGPASR